MRLFTTMKNNERGAETNIGDVREEDTMERGEETMYNDNGSADVM